MKEVVTAKQVHQHHHHQTTPATVSLETHQTDRGANTTIAATTHHLHEMEDETLSLTHRSVGICTSRHVKHRAGHHHRSHGLHNASSTSNNAPSTPKEGKPSKTHEQLLRRYQEHVDGKALIVF